MPNAGDAIRATALCYSTLALQGVGKERTERFARIPDHDVEAMALGWFFVTSFQVFDTILQKYHTAQT